jgi:hypothetical protein
MKSSLHSLNPFLPFLLNHTANLETLSILILYCNCQLSQCHLFSIIFAQLNCRLTPSIIFHSCLRFSLYSLESAPQKQRFPYCCVLIHCCKDVFTAPLLSNARGTDHRKDRSSIVACVRFRGNVFTVPLPSTELFWLSDVMSQYERLLACILVHDWTISGFSAYSRISFIFSICFNIILPYKLTHPKYLSSSFLSKIMHIYLTFPLVKYDPPISSSL